MKTLNIADRDVLYSLSWYMSARQTALRAALTFRTQLSAADLTDMRVHYSGYFLNLVAAIDLFSDSPVLKTTDFCCLLYSRLVFDGFQDGQANCSYIRELRNAVVHRGLDITSAAHFDGNFPMILAPVKIKNYRGTKTFVTFSKYLLHLIAQCESVVGQVMLDCLNTAGLLDATIDAEASVAEFREAIELSTAMPNHIKGMALSMEFKPEWAVDAHSSAIEKLRQALAPCITDLPLLGRSNVAFIDPWLKQ